MLWGHCEKQGLGRGTQVSVSDCLKWLLTGFQVSFWHLFCGLVFRRTKPTWEVLLPTEPVRQSRDWNSWHSCPRDDSSCLMKPTHKVPLHLQLGLKQATFSGIGETYVETTTCLLLQIFDFLINSPQLSPQIWMCWQPSHESAAMLGYCIVSKLSQQLWQSF